jgi:hypothetical protein
MSFAIDLTDTTHIVVATTTSSSEDSECESAIPHAPYTRSPLDAARGGHVRKPARKVRRDDAPRIIRKKKHTKASTASRR